MKTHKLITGVLAIAVSLLFGVDSKAESHMVDSLKATQYYRCGMARFGDVSPEMRRVALGIDSVSKTGRLDSIQVFGSASPDGPLDLNRALARQRAEGMREYLVFSSGVPRSMISVNSGVATWSEIADLIAGNPKLCQSEYADDVAAIINVNPNTPSAQLRKAASGLVWKWLATDVLPLMRNSTVTAWFNGTPQLISDAPAQGVYIEQPTEEVEVVEVSIAEAETIELWRRGIYVKTNLPAWLALWTNAAFEIDIAPHWSFELPVYYSGFNYFTRTLKFRTFAVQPEFRWWPSARNKGFFIGAHGGIVYYNVALKGDLRYQDHRGRTPAYGGGLSIGYRFRLTSDPNLFMEATVGGGVYRLHYDEFVNWTNGLKVGERYRTFYGLDRVALSIVYRFGVGKSRPLKNRKGGGL